MQHSDGFCRVKQRQNESGVLRDGKFFRGLFLTEVVGLTVITNHFLWLCSKWTRPHLVDGFKPIHKDGGIYRKNTTVCEIRQEGFGKPLFSHSSTLSCGKPRAWSCDHAFSQNADPKWIRCVFQLSGKHGDEKRILTVKPLRAFCPERFCVSSIYAEWS